MPTASLLAKDAVGTLQSLRQGFANIVVNFRRQNAPISLPTIRAPFFAVGLTFSTADQFLCQLVGMLAHTAAEDQATQLS